MATIKESFKNITGDTESLVKEYLNLVSVKFSEKLALILGIITSVFVLSLILLLIVIFGSFALAAYLNTILASAFLGYLLVAALYVVLFFFFIIRMLSTRTPMLSNMLVKFIISILDIETENPRTIKGVRQETLLIKQKIETGKIKISADLLLLRYTLIETLIKEFFGLFSFGKKTKGKKKEDIEEST